MHSETEVYRIERLSEHNLCDMEKLYHLVYGEDRPTPDFQQKYATAWSGAAYIGYFAYDTKGIPAAYYGVMPCLLQYGDTIILSAQSGDTMTHPDHRNKGLFVRLCVMTIDLCRETGIRLLFGFPNQNSYPGFVNKLGWTVTENLDCFTIPVSTIPLVGLAKRLPLLSGLYSGYAAAILKRYSTPPLIFNSAPCKKFGGVYRTKEYFQYKKYSKTEFIQLNKAKAWVKITDTFIIGDLELNCQDFDDTLYQLKQLAAKLGHRKLFFHCSPNTVLHTLFAQRYDSTTSFPVIFKDLGAGLPLHQLKFTFADIDTF